MCVRNVCGSQVLQTLKKTLSEPDARSLVERKYEIKGQTLTVLNAENKKIEPSESADPRVYEASQEVLEILAKTVIQSI